MSTPGEDVARFALRRSMEINGDKLPERQAPVAGINPQEFGRLEAEVLALRRDSDRLVAALERMEEKLSQIEGKLSEAKGGWRVLMMIGGASATLGAAAVTVAHKLLRVLG